MLTKDGSEVQWRYSDARFTTLTRAELVALKEGDAATRAIAHARLTTGQFFTLYRGSFYIEQRGRMFRRVGKRLIEKRLAGYASGIRLQTLDKILKNPDRGRCIQLLLHASSRLR